jgi:hypothetical protein
MITRTLAAAAVGLSVAACGSQPADRPAAHRPLTCADQWDRWQSGPAGPLMNDLWHQITTAKRWAKVNDLRRTQAAIVAMGDDASRLLPHPDPACADPDRLLSQALDDAIADGDNASQARTREALIDGSDSMKHFFPTLGKLERKIRVTVGGAAYVFPEG